MVETLLEVLRGGLGILVLLGICYLLSNNRKGIDWRLVITGIGLQLVLAILILKVPIVYTLFKYIANFFVMVLDFTEEGANFVLGAWPDFAELTAIDFSQSPPARSSFSVGYMFAFKVLPTIIFFAALSALLYYLGILQRIIHGFAWLMSKTMRLSGAESTAAAANVFIGQTEAPLIVRPYLENMTKSEIMCLMTGGMATIAGGVFAAFVGFLGGSDPETQRLFATHLLTASIISAPAAIVAAKMLFPEEHPDQINTNLEIPKDRLGSNMLDAISIGTYDGIKLAVNVGAMILVFLAFVAMVNAILLGIGDLTQLNGVIANATGDRFSGLNLEYLLGMLFAPFAWLIGVPTDDILLVGQLLGKKTVINEFVAYIDLSLLKSELSEKSIIIATYALCGFSNFSSIGIQIGGIGAIAPNQRTTLTSLGIRALIGGTVACFLTAAIAGFLV
ncbi:MAG: nucleoside transporter C-terminal domain-containing protein [Bacteroidota bacterium]